MSTRNLEDIIEERHRIFEEIRKLMEALDTNKSYEVQEKIIVLLKENRNYRKTIERNRKKMGKTKDEFLSTLIDYIRLVDGEREKELLKRLVEYAEKNPGPLRNNIFWLKQELEKSSDFLENIR